jgi:soluble lytic murein transglycosylase-like protein
MIRFTACAAAFALATTATIATAQTLDSNGSLAALVSKHAAANGVPESLVRRVIQHESRGNPRAQYRGGSASGRNYPC